MNTASASATDTPSDSTASEAEDSLNMNLNKIIHRQGSRNRSNVIEKDEIRRRRQQVKSERPRTLSTNTSKHESMSEDHQPIRMSDYLEKRSKMLGWKKYWFVLDGHLLTYYKSKDDYERISPTCGSINLGIASTVRPIQIKGCKGFPIQIQTRSQVIYLRSQDKPLLDKWLLALQETTSTPPKISSPFWTDPGVQFYRYSFAALSQWSLQDSPEDISGSLSNLPRNFYLNPSGSTLKKKCHSFASLPGTSASASAGSNFNSAGFYAGGNKEMTELKMNTPVRQANSMLVLESSRQASELRRELEKKLSAWNGMGRKMASNGTGRLSHSKSIENEHDNETSDENLQHHYDEIIDFEALYDKSVEESQIYEDVSQTQADPWEKLKMDQQSVGHGHSHGHSHRNTQLLTISEVPDSIQEEKTVNFSPISQNSFSGKKKGIAGIFQKIFKKDQKKKEAARRASQMVITGPVDLRKEHNIQTDTKPKPKVESPIKKSNSSTPSPPGSQNILLTDSVMNELKSRVVGIKRANSELTENSSSLLEQKSRTNFQLQRRSTIHDTPTPITSNNSNKNPTAIAAANPPMTHVFQNSITVEYQQKLAKFNRLSAHLNPSFVAVFKQPNPNVAVQMRMRRSSSCKIRTSGEPDDKETADLGPPVLPPKKRPGQLAINSNPYDYPSNNSPVRGKSAPGEQSQQTPSTPTLRELTKKNSAPDIMFKNSGEDEKSKDMEILPNISGQKLDLIDRVLCGPPPRPPKPMKKTPSAEMAVEGSFVNVDLENIGARANTSSSHVSSDPMSSHITPAVVSQESSSNADGDSPANDSNTNVNSELSNPDSYHPVSNITPESNKELDAHSHSQLQVQVPPEEEHYENVLVSSENTGPEILPEPSQSAESNGKPVLSGIVTQEMEEKDKNDQIKKSVQEIQVQVQTISKNENVQLEPVIGESLLENESTDGQCIEKSTTTIPAPVSVPFPPPFPGIRNSEETATLPNTNDKTENANSPENSPNNGAPGTLAPAPLNFSPTLSNRSVDIDNIDALSELSSDDPSSENVVVNVIGIPDTLDKILDKENESQPHTIYQNIKYATVNTILTEFEVVVEEEDELSEMYDAFPMEFLIPPIPTTAVVVRDDKNDEEKIGKPRQHSFRHSGIDELQKYLELESHSHSANGEECSPVIVQGAAALSRLGHSPAVDKLKRIVNN